MSTLQCSLSARSQWASAQAKEPKPQAVTPAKRQARRPCLCAHRQMTEVFRGAGAGGISTAGGGGNLENHIEITGG
eukprot:6127165-Prymnesium_polylepis.1